MRIDRRHRREARTDAEVAIALCPCLRSQFAAGLAARSLRIGGRWRMVWFSSRIRSRPASAARVISQSLQIQLTSRNITFRSQVAREQAGGNNKPISSHFPIITPYSTFLNANQVSETGFFLLPRPKCTNLNQCHPYAFNSDNQTSLL